jgi:hypothetical protein
MKISFETFFDFDDDTELKKGLKQIDTLEAALKGMVEAVNSSNERLGLSMTGVQASAEMLQKSVTGLNLSLDKNQKILAESATESESLVAEYVTLKNAQDSNAKTVANLNSQLDTLQKTKQRAIDTNTSESASINDLKARLAAAEAEYKKFSTAADNGVKQDNLEKIKALSYEYNNSVKALNAAKKGVQVAAGSYTELSKNVAAAKKQLKDMGNGLTANTTEFKALQKYVADGTQTLKDFDKSIGDNQRNVGDYAGALKDLKLQLKSAKDEMIGIAATLGEDSDAYKEAALRAGEINDKLKDTAEFTNSLSGEPIERFTGSLGLLKTKLLSLDFKGAQGAIKQLGAASKDLTFKDASKGIAQFGKGMAEFGKIILTNPIFLLVAAIALITIGIVKLKDVIKPLTMAFDAVGQAIGLVVDAVKSFSDSIGLSAFEAEEYADRVVKAYDKASEKINDYYDNQIKLANAAGASTFMLELKKQQAAAETAKAQIKALDDYKNKNSQVYTWLAAALYAYSGIVIDTHNKLSDEQQAAYDKAKKQVIDSNTEIKAIEVKHYEDLVKIQNDHNDKMIDSASKIGMLLLEIQERTQERIVDNETNGYIARNAASVKAQNIRIKMAQDEAKEETEVANRALRDLAERKRAELSLTQDNSAQIEATLEQSRKDELKEVGSNAAKRQEIIKRYQELALSLTETNAGQQAEIEKRYAIEEGNLREEVGAQVVMIEKKKQDKINEAVRTGSLQRKQILIDELNQEIEHNKSIVADILINYQSRVEALINNGQLELQLLKAQLDAKQITQQQYNDKVRESEEKLTDDLIAIFNERAERLSQISQNKQDVNTDQELIALNESLKARTTSLLQYNMKRKVIEDTASIATLQRQISLYKDERAEQEKFGKDTTEKDKQISDAERQISDITTQYEIDGRTKVRDQAITLMNDAFSAAQTIIQQQTDATVAQYEAQIQALSDKKDRELSLVGDDAQAKAIIEQNFANRSKRIQDQANAEKRKAAVFQKAISVVQATTNTALGVTEALGSTIPPFSFILAGLVAAAGAVQIASIISQPIPSFFKGTQHSPEGFVRVAERGPEAIISPKGEVSIAEQEQIRYVQGGSKILTAEKTASLLDDAKRYDEWNNMNQVDEFNTHGANILRSNSMQAVELSRVTTAIDRNTAEVTNAIKSLPQDVYDEKGYRQYENVQNTRILRLGTKYKF